MRIKVIDLFCGAGGTTTGVEAAEWFNTSIADVVACINHDKLAIKTHEINHPTCKHYTEDITIFDEHQLPQHDGENIWVLWASLECTNFSKAKGGKPRARYHSRHNKFNNKFSIIIYGYNSNYKKECRCRIQQCRREGKKDFTGLAWQG